MTNGDSHHFFYKNALLSQMFDFTRTGTGGSSDIYGFKQDSVTGTVIDMPGLSLAWNPPVVFQVNHVSDVWNWPFAGNNTGTLMDFNNASGYGLLLHGGVSNTSTQEHSLYIYAASINSSGPSSSVENWYQLRLYYWGA